MANHNILIVHAHPADFACDAYQPTHKDFIDTPVNEIPSATPENAYKLIP